ncbi:MAG: hypothetical protein AAFU80_24790 [Pseudomonadota bacterium]
MSSTDLQKDFFDFAGGRPAVSISKQVVVTGVGNLRNELSGVYPDAPSLLMANARLPVYNLAYSVFVDDLEILLNTANPELKIAVRATVHPFGDPKKVISTYTITFDEPILLNIRYNSSIRELYWDPSSSPVPIIEPEFSADAEDILASQGVQDPVIDNYIQQVETPIIWNTSSSFIRLVIDALPRYSLSELVPWLTFIDPLQITMSDNYILCTADKSMISIGGCTPIEMVVEPDPDFPYGQPAPIQTEISRADVSLYLPKTRLISFVSDTVQPAIMANTGVRGGVIKWQMSGAFGLKEFFLDVSGGIQVGNPFGGDLTLSGLFEAHTAIDFVGVARAWVDGPCGTKVGLASADVIADGRFAANIAITYAPTEGTLTADLFVTDANLNSGINIDAVGWPIDDILGLLADHLAEKEVKKLASTVARIGKWEFLRTPDWLLEGIEQDALLAPVTEGQSHVSSQFGLTSIRG